MPFDPDLPSSWQPEVETMRTINRRDTRFSRMVLDLRSWLIATGFSNFFVIIPDAKAWNKF
jgi:hypothetical protein